MIDENIVEEEIDGCDAICPYCGHRYQVECEDYTDEHGRAETCDACGKEFWRATEFDVTHRCSPIEDGKPVVWQMEIEVGE